MAHRKLTVDEFWGKCCFIPINDPFNSNVVFKGILNIMLRGCNRGDIKKSDEGLNKPQMVDLP